MSPLRGWRIAGQHQFLNGQVNYVAAVIYGINSATLPEKRNFKKRKRGTNIGPSLAIFGVVFGCRPDQGRNACRNSANAFIVSQRLHYQRPFYLRPKFRQLQRLLGPACTKSATSKPAFWVKQQENPKVLIE